VHRGDTCAALSQAPSGAWLSQGRATGNWPGISFTNRTMFEIALLFQDKLVE
jgi:hypothetical protein